MNFKYSLNKDIIRKNAIELVRNLQEVPANVFLYNKRINRKVHGQSIIGVLSGNFKARDVINIYIDSDNSENWSRVQEIINKFGTQL